MAATFLQATEIEASGSSHAFDVTSKASAANAGSCGPGTTLDHPKVA